MEYVLTEQMRVGYGKHEIVQNINLHLKRGEIMTLINDIKEFYQTAFYAWRYMRT